MMDDVLLSLQDLMAIYPVIRTIEAERLALSIQKDEKILAAIVTEIHVIAARAAASDVVARAAVEALKENDSAIAEARKSDERASLVADQVLIQRNFVSEAVRAAKENVVTGIGVTSGYVPSGLLSAGLALLVTQFAGPVAGIAAFVASFRQLGKAIEQAKKSDGVSAPAKAASKRRTRQKEQQD